MANFVINDTRTDYMGFLSDFLETTDPQSLELHPELVSDGDCVAAPGREYVVYSQNGSSTNFDLDLSAAAGRTLDCRFYNPRNGQFGSIFQRTGGGIGSFTKPDSNDWVLHIAAPPAQATSPNPMDQATGIDTSPDLSWLPAEGAVSYNVYFGETESPSFQANQSSTTFHVADLDMCTTSYWRVDAVNAYGITTGQLWSFTTVSVPGDFDCDHDVDQEDFGHLQACLTGSGELQVDPNCQDAILDGDGNVDGGDLAIFQGCMSGANVPPDPDCAE